MQVFLAVFMCFLALDVNSKEINPRDLLDAAREQLITLKGIVQGQVLVAHYNLDSRMTDFFIYSDNVAKSGAVDIHQVHETVADQIQTFKDSAQSAGVDVTTCVDVREQVIDRLSAEYTEQIVNCVDSIKLEAAEVVRDAMCIVDITINHVQSLEFQLDSCGTQITCITTIVNQIQLDMVRLPQNIQAVVNAADSLLSTLELSVNQCSNNQVAAYTSEANSLLGDIEACINRLLP